MDASGAGAALVSTSGAFFAVAAVWCLIGVGLDARSTQRVSSASEAHLVVSAAIMISALVAHIMLFFPEAFVLGYAGGISMVVASIFARGPRQQYRARTYVPAALTAIGVIALTIGLTI